jgi:hypothetical protein
MRGPASRSPELLSGALEQIAPRTGIVEGAALTDDFPVATAELDAIEAYLMPLIMDLLQPSSKRITDSEVPQCRKKIAARRGHDGNGDEILAVEPA